MFKAQQGGHCSWRSVCAGKEGEGVLGKKTGARSHRGCGQGEGFGFYSRSLGKSLKGLNQGVM